MADTDPPVTKRRVTMRSVVLDPAAGTVSAIEAVDYVDAARDGLLDAYVTDARRRWQFVGVSEEPDAGPAGYDGATAIPFGVGHAVRNSDGTVERVEYHQFPHELAGTYFPATDCVDCDHAPADPVTGVPARTIRVEA